MVNIDLFRMCICTRVQITIMFQWYLTIVAICLCGQCTVWAFQFQPIAHPHLAKKAVGNRTCIHSQVSGANTDNFVSFSDDSLGKHSKMIKECE